MEFRQNALNSSKAVSAPVFQKQFLNEIPIIRNDIFIYPGMADTSLFKVSDRVKDLIDSTFVLNKSELFDKEWIVSSEKYVQQLSISDKSTILGYTYQGDEYINNYLRSTDTFTTNKRIIELLQNDLKDIYTSGQNTKGFPFFSQLFTKNNINVNNLFDTNGQITAAGSKKAIEVLQTIGINSTTPVATSLKILVPYVEQFGEDLRRIIKNAPRLTKPLKVYRGSKTDYLNEVTPIKGFTSTTISINVAENRFSNYNKNSNTKILYEFIINPSINCIFLPAKNTWPGLSGKPEFEVILDTDINATPSDIKFRRIFNPPVNKSYINKTIINGLNIDADKKKELLDNYNKDNNNFSYTEMISLIEFRNVGEQFKTRVINLNSNSQGGKRKRNKTIKKSKRN